MEITPGRLLPFTAIVGQDDMKNALVWNVVDPAIGGVLIRGEKGTAKSTAVRALAEVLPEIAVVRDCPYSCDPFDSRSMCPDCLSRSRSGQLEFVGRKARVVSLPLGATEDRLVGSLDIERAMKEGVKVLEPGLLASANRGILYVDEVNLLEDHLADLLLDAAALGVNIIEREGIRFSHPASFSLVGTMNPEEGEVRPQLLDRFGLQVTVGGSEDVQERSQIVRLVDEFDKNAEALRAEFEPTQGELRQRIAQAMHRLKEVRIGEEMINLIVLACMHFEVRTHRAEITTARAAKAIAALDGRRNVETEDVREALRFALPHRMRRTPFERPVLAKEDLDDKFDELKKRPLKGLGLTLLMEKRIGIGVPHSKTSTGNSRTKRGKRILR